MANERYQILSFEQQLKAEYWDWTIEKLKLFDDIDLNRDKILKEIYLRLSHSYEDFIVAMNIHDKDPASNSYGLVFPHVHLVIKFKGKSTINKLAQIVGIEPQFIKKPSKGPHNFENLMAYLIHAKNSDKYQYEPTDVKTFDTFDYITYYEEKATKWTQYKAKNKRKSSSESIDWVLEQVYKGKLKYEDFMIDDDLAFIYSNHQQSIRDRISVRAERLAYNRLKDLENDKYKLTVLYVEGSPGVGKSYFARKIARQIKEYGNTQGFESEIFSASSSNLFDDYSGEDIMILDDLRFDSMSASDWLKVFDPLNTAKMSARYKNKLVVPRIIIMTNYEKVEDFFGNFVGEDLNQFIRRVNYDTKIESNKEGLELFDKTFTLSQSCKLKCPQEKQINEDDFITLEYGFKELYSDNDTERFLNKILHELIYPRIYPKTTDDFTFLSKKIKIMEK